QDNTATVADGDYVAAAGMVTFAPGTTSQPVTATVNCDNQFEPDDTFFVNLTLPVNATIADGQGVGTIQNDDTQPTISIGDYSHAEAAAGPSLFTFPVPPPNASLFPYTTLFRSQDNTATVADGDYVAAAGMVTFAPGTT